MADHNVDMLVIQHWSNNNQKQIINACFVDSDVDDNDDTDDGGLVQR